MPQDLATTIAKFMAKVKNDHADTPQCKWLNFNTDAPDGTIPLMSTTDSFQPQQKIVWLVVILFLLGEMMLFSATGVLGIQKHHSEFYYLTRQGIAGLTGFCLMILLSRVPYQIWQRLAFPLLAAQIILLAATHFSPFTREALGAHRWLEIGGFQFQPSELAKISLPVYLASLLAAQSMRQASAKRWAASAIPIVLLFGLIYFQPDLGTTVILSTIIFAILFAAGLRARYVFGLFGTGAFLLVISLLHSEYRRRRLAAFLNPWADPQGSGFQSIQSFLSFHSGKLFGVGIGNGNSKLFFLPEVHTDFIFSLIGEELGFVGVILILLLFAYFGYLIFKIPSKASDTFGSLLAFALALALVLQLVVNLGGVTGLIPIKGLPVPFFSWGRTALIVNFAMVGILLNIVSQSEIISKKAKAGKP